jgi:glycosyltransferase involved in cell wall biosynthesis
MKVICVVDKVGTALDRLAKGVKDYHNNIDYIVCDIHPKRPDPEQLTRFEEAVKDADVIDYQYFKSAEKLRELYPEIKNIPSILTHNNAYSHREGDWNDYQIVVANNLTLQSELSTITSSRLEYIPLTVDHRFWTFNTDWKPKEQVIMVANRIEGKKGIREVAIACAELGLKFVLVGAISDTDYFHGIESAGNVEYHEQVSDEKLRELYHESLLHVCNSQDNFESGTMPILEAMYCGTPVLTRNVGHVPDLDNGSNMFIYQGDNEDVLALTERLREVLSDRTALEEVRQKAWNTVKTRNFERRAYAYQKLYRSIVSDDTPVSIIVPVCDKPDITRQCLEAIAKQTYKNIEVIVVNDDALYLNKEQVDKFKRKNKTPIRYISSGHWSIKDGSKDYGLARARNKGIIEATGEILVFCDQRIIMDSKAIQVFVDNLQVRHWGYGSKGVKKEFVENFSCVFREDLVRLGMFNERCDRYGAMSQEIRSRAKYAGFTLDYLPDAKAIQVGKSSNKYTKKLEITESKNWLWKVGLDL